MNCIKIGMCVDGSNACTVIVPHCLGNDFLFASCYLRRNLDSSG